MKVLTVYGIELYLVKGKGIPPTYTLNFKLFVAIYQKMWEVSNSYKSSLNQQKVSLNGRTISVKRLAIYFATHRHPVTFI